MRIFLKRTNISLQVNGSYILNITVTTLIGTMASDDGNEYGSDGSGDVDSGDESLDRSDGGGEEKCKMSLGESVRLSSFPW